MNISDTGSAAPAVFSARDRFMVATPCYDYSITDIYYNSLRECQQKPLARFRHADGSVVLDSLIAGRYALPNDSHIDRARNVIANLWYNANETDWLLWIDADIEFNAAHIARLFVHAHAGHKFICGLYALKSIVPTFVCNRLEGKPPDPETGLVEVRHAGTGFMLLHRDVFTRLQSHPRVKPYRCAPNTPWAGQTFHAYFGSGVYGEADAQGLQNWQSEDWMICEWWRELGGQVMADTGIQLRHLGRLLFPPPVEELVEAIKALRARNHPGLPPTL